MTPLDIARDSIARAEGYMARSRPQDAVNSLHDAVHELLDVCNSLEAAYPNNHVKYELIPMRHIPLEGGSRRGPVHKV